jgi:hypothetical protein
MEAADETAHDPWNSALGKGGPALNGRGAARSVRSGRFGTGGLSR